MTDLVVETFSQETIEDVEGSIAAFFLGLCGQGVVSLDEETDSLIQDSKLYGQDYDLIKVLHKSSQSMHIIQTYPFLSPGSCPPAPCSRTPCSPWLAQTPLASPWSGSGLTSYVTSLLWWWMGWAGLISTR